MAEASEGVVAGGPTCSVVVPVYNHASLTRQCLKALLEDAAPRVPIEVIVVDDGSTDVTPRLLADYGDRIRTVTRSVNGGFARACNDGAAIARGAFVVFLNNDTIPEPGWLDALVLCAREHVEAGVIGSKLLYPNGTVQHAGVVVCQDGGLRHLYAGFPGDHPAVNRSRCFQVVTAACALVRREAFEQAEGFDTDFVNGYEDVDLCIRLRRLGYTIHYCPKSVVRHLESVSRGAGNDFYNTTLFVDRWATELEPDDLRYYIEDGLLGIEYGLVYPARVRIDPGLATIDSWERSRAADSFVRQTARAALDLIEENARLAARVQDLELALEEHGRDRPTERLDGRLESRLVSEGSAHPPAHGSAHRLVSVVIPVKNGGRWLRSVLARVLRQARTDSLEIVALDSGSADDTVDILRSFGATVAAIEPGAFDHGLARMEAARYAHGEILVFLNQDALPANSSWLTNLLAPLDNDAEVAGVCSRVLPAENADLLAYRDGMLDPNASGERSVRALTNWQEYKALDPERLRLFLNFHTISAAVRADVLSRIPFRRVTTLGEDILWAKEVLESGLKVQHEPSSIVLHSHDYSLAELLRRHIEDGIATREICGRQLAPSTLEPLVLSTVREDWRFLEHECELAGVELTRWRQKAAARRAVAFAGQLIGLTTNVLPDAIRSGGASPPR